MNQSDIEQIKQITIKSLHIHELSNNNYEIEINVSCCPDESYFKCMIHTPSISFYKEIFEHCQYTLEYLDISTYNTINYYIDLFYEILPNLYSLNKLCLSKYTDIKLIDIISQLYLKKIILQNCDLKFINQILKLSIPSIEIKFYETITFDDVLLTEMKNLLIKNTSLTKLSIQIANSIDKLYNMLYNVLQNNIFIVRIKLGTFYDKELFVIPFLNNLNNYTTLTELHITSITERDIYDNDFTNILINVLNNNNTLFKIHVDFIIEVYSFYKFVKKFFNNIHNNRLQQIIFYNHCVHLLQSDIINEDEIINSILNYLDYNDNLVEL